MMKNCLGLFAMLALAAGIAAEPAQATSIGTLTAGSSFSDTIQSSGPTFSRDYSFHLNGTATGLTILATAIAQGKGAFGVDSMKITLMDAANHVIAFATGSPLVGLDSFAQSGVALGAGDYLLEVLGDVTPGKQAFVSVALAANNVAETPIPGAGLMLLTGLGGIGGLAYRRRKSAAASMASLPTGASAEAAA
jgi:hypothetical protein